MQTLNRNISLFCCVLLLVVSACNNKKNQPKPVEYLGLVGLSEVKDYLYFKPGSYWVYKNSRDQSIDTIVVLESKLDTLEAESYLRVFQYEDISITMQSKRDSAIYKIYSVGPWAGDVDFVPTWTWYCTRSGGEAKKCGRESKDPVCRYYYQYDKNYPRGDYGNYLTQYIEKLDAYYVRGTRTTYNDVIKFSINGDVTVPYPSFTLFDNQITTYYYAPNAGIVRIDCLSLEAFGGGQLSFYWELIDSKILK